MTAKTKRGAPWRYWPRLLLIIPFALVAWVPLYNRIEPRLLGIPFFYWYQLAAIIVGALVVMAAYYLDRRETVAAERAAQKTKPGKDAGPGGRP